MGNSIYIYMIEVLKTSPILRLMGLGRLRPGRGDLKLPQVHTSVGLKSRPLSPLKWKVVLLFFRLQAGFHERRKPKRNESNPTLAGLGCRDQ